MEEFLKWSGVRQGRLVREGKISSRELVAAHLQRIESINPALGAAVEIFSESALAEADAADDWLRRSGAPPSLHGVPFTVKDSIEIAGHQCTAGTWGRRSAAAARADASLVQRLRAAGGIPIARTNLPDLLFAFESDNLIFGRTNNPYALDHTSGGSSGGEAALQAACGSPFGLGSDAAGSVRIPAAFCGIASIKPTSGRLARTGHVPAAGGWIEALWQIGPMARCVEDLVMLLPLLAGPDCFDHTVIDMPCRDVARIDPAALRIAFYTDNGTAAADPEVAQVVRSAAAQFPHIEEARPACLAAAYDLEMQLLGADAGDGLREYLREIGSTEVHPLLTGWLDKLEAYRTDMAGFQACWDHWQAFRSETLAFLSRYDAVLCPAYIHAGLPHGASVEDACFRGFSHTMAYNVAGAPAAVVRCGTSAEGLPIAVQIVARPWREDLALAVALRLEEVFGGWQPPPAIPA